MGERKMTPEQEELVTKNIALAYYMKSKFSNIQQNEDIESACLFGLVKASIGFDPKKGVKFATFAARVITNECLMFLRNNKKHKENNISLETIIKGSDEGEHIRMINVLGKPDYYEFIDHELLVEGLKSLNEKELKITLAFFVDERTQRSIANEMKLSQSYVSRIVKNSLKKMRNQNEVREIAERNGTLMIHEERREHHEEAKV